MSVLCLAGVRIASGELVFTNFSPAKPLKVMALGDSITDDCVFNGAWRAPFEAALENSGYPFSFVGRQTSIASGAFVKTKHEGYCGAVVGLPGPGHTPIHGYAGPDVYLQKIAQDALTNAIPDLVLVLIGANDIGQGRNPYRVATNNIPRLLDIIFSNAPNARIILTKTTTLQNASVAGLDYGAFATNVPIYNATLQAVVNQRRAAGQEVFLADMFSAVDYATMFNSDHLHPNAAGLAAIAGEFAARLEAITLRPDRFTTTFIHGGDTWKYFDAGDPGANWMNPGYDDSGWSNGIGRLGYGDPATATTIGFGPEATNKYPAAYFRRSFSVPWNAVVTNLNLRLAQADGAVVWLNGVELLRTNLPAGPLDYTNLALNVATGFTAHVYHSFNRAVSNFPAGPAVLAVEVHLASPATATLGFDLELIASGILMPPPQLSIGASNGIVWLNWPESNGAGFTLDAAAAVNGAWSPAALPLATNTGQIGTISTGEGTRFFRLRKP